MLGFEQSEAVFSLTFIELLWGRAGWSLNSLMLIGLINSNKQVG